MASDYVDGHYDSDEERRKLFDWDSYYGKHGVAGVYGQDKVKCQPFSTSSPEAFDPLRRIKVELRSLLITSGPLTAEEILVEFRDTFDFDIEDHGFSTVEELLTSMSDAVVETRDGYGNVIYIANNNEKSADINSLIQRTKGPISPSKRSHRLPCSTGLTRGQSLPRTSATVADIQPKFQRCRMSWLGERVASTKTIGNFPCRPRRDPRPLLGKGPRSDERCTMVMDMVREIGQPSPDGVEVRVHLENLINFYYKETGVCLLGKIFAFEQYIDEMKHRDFARFWRVMFDSQPGKETLCFIVVPSVGLYPPPGPEDAVPDCSDVSPHDSSTVDDSYEGQIVDQVEEETTEKKSPTHAPRLAAAGLRMISHTVRAVVNSNLRDCTLRGDDKPCNRLPISREDLHARRVTPPPDEDLPLEVEEHPVVRNESPAAVLPIEHLNEMDLKWMVEAKVIENVKEGGANLLASMFFVPPRSILSTAVWGNVNYERFSFIENQLRGFAEHEKLTPASILRLGQEYITWSEDGRLGRAIFVKHSDGDLLSFVLLDYHSFVIVPHSAVYEMPPMFSCRSLPSNTFLAPIRGVQNIPASLYDVIDAEIAPKNGSLTGELQMGEVFNIDQGRTRLVDWIWPSNANSWFSDCCLQEGATEDVSAPRKINLENLRSAIQFLEDDAGFSFDPEMEEIVFHAPLALDSQNDNSVSQISSQIETVEIHRQDESDVSVDGNKRAVRFSDQPDDLFHYTLDTETGSQHSTSSSMVIHDGTNAQSHVGGLSQRVCALMNCFIILHCSNKKLEWIPESKKFNLEVFQTVFKDPLQRQLVLSRFMARLYYCKSIWKDPSDHRSLDILASTINKWISADL